MRYVPDHLKTQEMCKIAIEKYQCTLKFVPDSFVTQEQIKIWHDDDYNHEDNGLIKLHETYKKQKAQKSKIKEELLPITWHPSRGWDWSGTEDEKKETEKFLNI